MIWTVVVALAIVQSWFGVGLLLLGTPILLLLGYPFEGALWILLPCSLTVSALQLVVDRQISPQAVRSVLVFAVPGVVAGTAFNAVSSVRFDVTLFVAGLLAVAAFLRLSPVAARRVQSFSARHEGPILGLTGLIHGLSNMGGSLLIHQASSRHSEKLAIRQHVAVGYVLFTTTQLIVLLITRGNGLEWRTAGLAAAAGATFLVVGRLTFQRFSQRAYSLVLSAFMLIIAIMLVARH